MHKLISVLLILLYSVNSWADPVSISNARQLALNFFSEKSGRNYYEIFIEEEFIQTNKNTPVYYVFNLNEGFIIIAGDHSVFPVLGYSFHGHFIDQNIPENVGLWLNSYKDQIAFAIRNNTIANPTIIKVWNKYLAKDFDAKNETEEVKPLLYTNWGQGCFYNTEFPEYENDILCNHTYTGCVATAMAEIMKFYNYPKQGTGSNGYNSSIYGWLEADFENTYYNWTEMQYQQLEDENPGIAELIYHCAVSINTVFLPSGIAGAYDNDVRDALIDYFGYEDQAQFHLRNDYSGDWGALLRSELDNRRPVLYGAVAEHEGNLYGHTLVCDGYQDSTFFHLNWGWEGVYNGYYYLDSLTANGYDYNLFHDAIVGIRPDIGNSYMIYAPENINADVIGNNISLQWNKSIEGTLEQLGYNIFRNDLIVNEAIVTDTFFMDTGVASGSHNYKVSTVYIGDEAFSESEIQVMVEGNAISDIREFPFNVFPNPASDFIKISGITKGNTITGVTLYDLTGREIKNYFVNNNESIQLRLPEISGLFILKIESGEYTFPYKILIGN